MSQTPILYEAVAEKSAGLIRSGVLRPGDRIPSVRRASQQHRVSVTTAVQAYLRLEDRGLIEARPKSGFYVRALVRESLPEPALTRSSGPPAPVGFGDLAMEVMQAVNRTDVTPLGAAWPSPDLLPVAKLNRALAAVSRTHGRAGVLYDIPPGCEKLRREIARRSLDWGSSLSPSDIVTTCGAMEALVLCLQAIAKPGEIIALETPTYFGVLQAIQQLGYKALEIPTHPRTGMDLDALERALKTRKIAGCLSMPNFHNPLGCVMPDANKKRLVEMLAQRGVPLIEDDIYGDLHFGKERPRVAQSYDKEGMVLLCGSFSKTLAPGYRVGWVAPGRYAERVKSLKCTNTVATATLPQLAIAEFLANGGYDHFLRSIRGRYMEQVQHVSRAVAETFPAGTKLTRPAGGFVLWVELPGKVDAVQLHRRALREKISIAPGPIFSASQGFQNFIRLSCGHPWSSRIEQAIAVLGHLVKEITRARSLIVTWARRRSWRVTMASGRVPAPSVRTMRPEGDSIRSCWASRMLWPRSPAMAGRSPTERDSAGRFQSPCA